LKLWFAADAPFVCIGFALFINPPLH
jgi:hypothetical protein